MQTSPLLHVDVAIVGDGASAVIVACRLLAQASVGQSIALIGPGTPGQGVAYATTDPGHRLNVPAGKMSAFGEVQDDFVQFLRQAGLAEDAPGDRLADRYLPRAWYGAYLADRLSQARVTSAAQLLHLSVRVQEVDTTAPVRQLRLEDGRTLTAAHVVLACGNALRPFPLDGADCLPATARIQAWDVPALADIGQDADVLVVGSGLSMADVVVTLRSGGHRGRLHVVSRHGLQPQMHASAAPWPFDGACLLALGLRERVARLRAEVAAAHAAAQPWQAVFDAIRPLGVALWTSLDVADQRRFLRHMVRLWDVHRHRIAPDVAAVLADAMAQGQLQHHRHGVRTLEHGSQGGLRVVLGSGCVLHVDAVINATGIQTRIAQMDDPLLQGLLASGIARPGPHGLGLDVDADGRLRDASGSVHQDISVIGSLRMGNHWETIAIPELRQQAAQIAARSLAAG